MKFSSIGTRIILSLSVAIVGYLASYLYLRSTSIERWDRDGHDYVIFPQQPVIVYYFFRPLSLADAALTGMRFHIGPHED
jgi:hypothetical protein